MTRLTWLCACIGLSACIITAETDPVCGDGQREGTEECDDGNNASGDGCTNTCVLEPYCGDGVVDVAEECDDGNNAAGDSCSAACAIEPFCGDGTVDPGEQCDDGDRDPSDGCSATCRTEIKYATTANWSFSTTQAPTVSLLCPVGFDTVAVYSQALAANDAPLGTPLIDLFSCADGGGTIVPVFQGRYRTYVAVTNTAGTVTYATSTSAIVDLTTGNQTFTTKIFTNGGYFQLAWNLIGAASNNALTCTTAPNDGISVVSTDVATPTNFRDDLFTCSGGSGLTAELAEGTYTVSVSAIDNQGLSIGTAPTLVNKVIMAPNKVTDLGTVTIPIDGL